MVGSTAAVAFAAAAVVVAVMFVSFLWFGRSGVLAGPGRGVGASTQRFSRMPTWSWMVLSSLYSARAWRAEFAADAAVSVAAERHLGVSVHPAVDPDGAGAQVAGSGRGLC